MEKTKLGLATLSSYKKKKYLMKRFNAFLVDDDTPLKELRRMAASVTIEDEIWAKIPGFPNTVSTYGRVRSDRNNDFMIPFLNRAGYLTVRLKRDGKYVSIPIHRLVAIVFIERGDDERVFFFKYKNREDYLFQNVSKDCVVHSNGRIFDNRALNLLWVDKTDIHKIRKKRCIPVIKICPITGKALDFYESLEAAGAENFVNPTAIGNCIKGKSKTSAGYLWIIDTGEDIDFAEDEDVG